MTLVVPQTVVYLPSLDSTWAEFVVQQEQKQEQVTENACMDVLVQVQRRNPLANEVSRVFLPVVGETVGSDSVNGLFLFPEASTVACHLPR